MREVARLGIALALRDWSPEDLEQVATLFNRLVDDFVANADAAIDYQPSD